MSDEDKETISFGRFSGVLIDTSRTTLPAACALLRPCAGDPHCRSCSSDAVSFSDDCQMTDKVKETRSVEYEQVERFLRIVGQVVPAPCMYHMAMEIYIQILHK